MNKQTILSWLKATDVPLTVISQKTGISRKTLYNWINGSDIRQSNIDKIINVYNADIEIVNQKLELKGDSKMNQSTVQLEASKEFEQKNRLINYQEKEIEELRKKLQQVESENSLIKLDNIYEDCIPDFQTEVHMRNVFSLKSIERNIKSVDHVKPLAKALNLKRKTLYQDYFAIGRWFISNEHPVDTIIDKHSLSVLKSATEGIPKQAQLYQFTMGAFYLKFEVLYIANNRFCMTQSFCKINWSTTPVVNAKNVILHSCNIENLDKEINN
tara:strand:+ start:2333 stop:3145 length:813 start_codon:yes stop_codon:yes gene_type:complete